MELGFEPDVWNCSACPFLHCDAEGAVITHKTDGTPKRSIGPSTNGGLFEADTILGKIRSPVCLKPQAEGAGNVLELYRHYKNGYLPGPGALLEQPARLVEAFGLIDAAVNHGNRVRLEDARKKMENPRGL